MWTRSFPRGGEDSGRPSRQCSPLVGLRQGKGPLLRAELESLLFPAITAGLQVADADAESTNFILFVGTAFPPSVSTLAVETGLPGKILGEGWMGHEEQLLKPIVSRVVMKST